MQFEHIDGQIISLLHVRSLPPSTLSERTAPDKSSLCHHGSEPGDEEKQECTSRQRLQSAPLGEQPRPV